MDTLVWGVSIIEVVVQAQRLLPPLDALGNSSLTQTERPLLYARVRTALQDTMMPHGTSGLIICHPRRISARL